MVDVDNKTLPHMGIFNGYSPEDGAKALTVVFDFTANTSYGLNLKQYPALGKLSGIQSVYIDNSGNNQPLTVQTHVFLQAVTCPAGAQGYFPLLCAREPSFTVSLPALGTNAVTRLQFLNVPVPSEFWFVNGSSSGGGTLGNNADAVAPVSTGLNGVDAYTWGFDGTNFDRLRSGGYNVAPTGLTSGVLYVNAQIWGGNLSGGAVAKSPTVDVLQDLEPDVQVLALYTASSPMLYDGASAQNRQRGNIDVTLLASAAHTTTQTSADQININGKRIKIILDTTVIGTGSVTLTLNGKDPASGKYYPIFSGAAVVTNTTNVYTIGPSAVVTANVSANDFIPRTFQIVVTANNANSATYSVGYSLDL